MLLECKNCGAPLDVQGGELLTRCKYCGTISRAKKLKTVAVVTPPQWQPPVQWVPPPQARADSNRMLVYDASLAIGRLLRGVVTIALLLLLLPILLPLAIQWIESAITQKQVDGTFDAAKKAMEFAEQQMRSAARQGAPPQARTDLLTPSGAAELSAKSHERFAGARVRVLELLLYPAEAVLKIQDPQNPKHIDQYTYRDGKFEEPMPVNVQYLRGKIEQHLFDLDEIGLERFQTFAGTALDRLKLEDGKVTHVIVDKSDGHRVTLRIYAASPRENGMVELDTSGKIRRGSK